MWQGEVLTNKREALVKGCFQDLNELEQVKQVVAEWEVDKVADSG